MRGMLNEVNDRFFIISDYFCIQKIMLRESVSTELDMPLEHLYNVLIDVESYEEFLPWCSNIRVLKKIDGYMEAEMQIVFAGISKNYVSKIFFQKSKDEEAHISVISESDLFDTMHSSWHIKKIAHGSNITFEISMKLKNSVLDNIVSLFFSKARKKIMKAFELRARSMMEIK